MNIIKKIKKNKKWLIILLLIIGVIGYIQYSNQAKNKPIKTTTVKQKDLQEELALSGEIDAEEKTTLRFQTSGKINYIGVKTGQFVRKGTLIASLDKQELQKQLKKELNTFLSTRYTFDQTKDDYDNTGVTDSIKRILDKSQLTLDNSIIDVELKKLSLDLSTIYAPIDGIITSMGVKVAGVNITPAQAEFEIINPNSLYFTVTGDQTEITELQEGMPVSILLDAYPDDTFSGVLTSISYTPKEGEAGTVYEIKIGFENKMLPSSTRLGMTGDATFITKKAAGALYVPLAYVKFNKDKPYVFIKKNAKIIKQTVEVGIETDTNIEIKAGLQKGNVVYDKAR